MDDKLITIAFTASPELKKLVQKWAREEDRSLSAVIRRLIEQENKRKEEKQSTSGFEDL